MNSKSRIIIESINGEAMEKSYHVPRDEAFTLVFLSFGGEARITVVLEGANASAQIIGLVQGYGERAHRIHTVQHHTARNTTSNLLIRSVLRDASDLKFTGEIRVEKEAQKTDAYQRNENLVLSGRAHAISEPSLEILANDVRCTHGATIGTISDEHLWYLASRGISGENARELIIRGFLDGALEKIGDTIARKEVQTALWQTI